jgi:predicted 3-demethylubiquinone-9 3-methyltransferase (glyoxalase superfamily)
MAKNTICLWYDKDAEAAARFYVETFPEDKWGVSWQITPRVLMEAWAAGGDEAKRAFDAMLGMKKIDVAAIRAARRG